MRYANCYDRFNLLLSQRPASFSSPQSTLVISKIGALLWAFQLHGWACAIPCVAFIATKLVRMVAPTTLPVL